MAKISEYDAAAMAADADALAGVQMGVTKKFSLLVLLNYFLGGLGTASELDADIDPLLAADSDTLLATQKAAKAYVDGRTASLQSTANLILTGA